MLTQLSNSESSRTDGHNPHSPRKPPKRRRSKAPSVVSEEHQHTKRRVRHKVKRKSRKGAIVPAADEEDKKKHPCCNVYHPQHLLQLLKLRYHAGTLAHSHLSSE